MTIDTVFNIVSATVLSVGGAGAIIIGVVKFLSNFIAEKTLKKYDEKLNKDLETYKHTLEMEAEKYSHQSEQLTFVTQLQFETEFKAYQNIFDYLFDFSVNTGELFPTYDQVPVDKEQARKLYIKRYKSYCASFDKFSEILEKNAPFIPKKNYDMFVELRTQAHELGCMYPDIRIIDDPRFEDDHAKLAHENYKKTRLFNDSIQTAKDKIRVYLSTLKVQQ